MDLRPLWDQSRSMPGSFFKTLDELAGLEAEEPAHPTDTRKSYAVAAHGIQSPQVPGPIRDSDAPKECRACKMLSRRPPPEHCPHTALERDPLFGIDFEPFFPTRRSGWAYSSTSAPKPLRSAPRSEQMPHTDDSSDSRSKMRRHLEHGPSFPTSFPGYGDDYPPNPMVRTKRPNWIPDLDSEVRARHDSHMGKELPESLRYRISPLSLTPSTDPVPARPEANSQQKLSRNQRVLQWNAGQEVAKAEDVASFGSKIRRAQDATMKLLSASAESRENAKADETLPAVPKRESAPEKNDETLPAAPKRDNLAGKNEKTAGKNEENEKRKPWSLECARWALREFDEITAHFEDVDLGSDEEEGWEKVRDPVEQWEVVNALEF